MSSLFCNRTVAQKARFVLVVGVRPKGRSGTTARAPLVALAQSIACGNFTTTTKESYRQLLQQQQQDPATATTMATATAAATTFVVPPVVTKAQLNALRFQAAIPMIGFGFMDQTIMIHAGNAIDCTIGVTLGISTLAAAAVGQVVANAGGILFGQQLERFFTRFLPPTHQTNLNPMQHSLPVVEKARFSGTFWGVVVGCFLGLGNLLFIDTQWTNERKQQQQRIVVTNDSQSSFSFEIQVSNQHSLAQKHQPATTLTICGPDVDGMLAIVLTALKEEGYSVLEMSAKPKLLPKTHSASSSNDNGAAVAAADNNNNNNNNNGESVPAVVPPGSLPPLYEEVFVVRRKGEAIPEEELASLTQRLLKEKLALLQPQKQKEKCTQTFS